MIVPLCNYRKEVESVKTMNPSEIVKDLSAKLALTTDTLQLLLRFVDIDKLEVSEDAKAILKEKIAKLNLPNQ